MTRILKAFALASLALAWGGTAAAQTAGEVRAQNQPVPGAALATPAPGDALLREPREDMRQLVQNIRSFAQRQNRAFSILVTGGTGLLTRSEPGNSDVRIPARGYLRTIDGLLIEAPFYGLNELNAPTTPERQERLFAAAALAKTSRIPVFSIDYADQRSALDKSYKSALQKDFVHFVAEAYGMEINRLGQPGQPVHANPNNVLTPQDVRNYVVIRDSAGFGSQAEFALELHNTNYDLVVVDVFHRKGEPLSKRAVETLKYKKLGARRLVFAYLNIGVADSFRYYWQPGWREGSPAWITAAYPGDPERYFVEYWNPAWQDIITGNTNSYLYGIIEQGFDGVVLDGLDSYLYFEGGAEAYAEGR